MSVNDEGWTEIMDLERGYPAQDVNFIQATTSKRTRTDRRRRIQVRPRHAWRKEQLDELGRDQQLRGR